MKKLFKLSSIGILLISLGGVAGAAQAQGEFVGFKLMTCTVQQTRCLTLSSEKALGSHLKALYVLTNPSVELILKGKQLPQKIKTTSGYIDFELQRAVMAEEIKPGEIKETVIDLKTLKVTATVMR